ncbi:MAG TPA: hypothetical protein VGW34_11650 [Allosphingosinicella sp.]|nr:hypothetical protein [Allosphingosinicella sp.]
MRGADFLLAAFSAFIAAVPAAAQGDPPTGSRLGNRQYIRSEHDTKASVRAAHRMAGCIYLKQASRVNAALTSVDPADARRRLSALGSKGTCINLLMRDQAANEQQVTFPHDVYRGMLAEAALRQDFGRRSLAALPRQATYSRPWFAATGRPLAVDEMAACVADTNPAGVQALLGTTAETDGERAALSRLMPSVGPCLTIGATLNANRQSLRAALAEALYQRLRAPAAAPTGAPR